MKKSRLTSLLLILCINLFLVNILNCQNRIYVHPSLGNDNGNDGRNIANPIRTLTKAGQVCHGGDTIFIRGGHFTDTVYTFYQIDTLGIGTVWIMPYFNESVILDGSGYNFQSWEAVLNIDHARNVMIQNLHVMNNNNGGAGIRIVSDSSPFFITKNITVRKCTVNHTYRQGILVQAKYVTIDSCEISDAVFRNANEQIVPPDHWEFAVGTYLWPNNVDCWNNITFKNNKIHNCWGEGIVALRCYNFIIENNHVYDCYSAYIYVDNSRKGIIRNNWVHSTDSTYNRHYNSNFYAPGVGIQWAAEGNIDYRVDSLISDLDIYNNLIIRTNVPISWWRDSSNPFSNNSYKNINVYYNTIFGTFGYESFHLDTNTSGIFTPVNCNFKNNIICLGKYPLNVYQHYITTSSHYQYWQIDYNCFINGNIPVGIQHNISGPPLFVDSMNINIDTNFRIKLNSNCRHTAIPINGINRDYWKVIRDSTLPCIGFHEYGGVSGIGFIGKEYPESYNLTQNFPNPFNNSSKFRFEIAKLSDVKIVVYDVLGREVQSLVNEKLQPGTYEVSFDGSMLNSGVYFYRLTTDGFSETKKMILMK